ncbi:SDR family oxidoreductase [Allorhizobium sp. BGMRC 0089]|uniref:UDP-glucuronic acid decarboxylase family protein n=1 Tax=Allorhizobium sonneratiae TaxID=2934936 RepID=UPI0020337EBD|nr:UDP-glucuronic acid decarboxylase family protein [Allorhizobium sonneratiae]MCM2293981.1 SDR family oxidoreductase [Allorhizobium sonneratiae]
MARKHGRTRGGTVLVAGGAGFIGSHLMDALLTQGCRVICVDNFLTGRMETVRPLLNHPDFRLIRADICDLTDLDERPDRIYNLACAASPPHYQADPIHTMMTCVRGSGNLLALAARTGARFLQASTSEVYGDPEQHPQREDYLGHVNCTGPRACYDEGKRAAEALCFDMLRAKAADVRVARIFNTYGPRMRADDGRIVSNLIVQALSGQPLTIYGHGGQTRSFCYVSDLVRGLMALMAVETNPQGPVNLGNPEELTVNGLADMVRDMVPEAGPLVTRPLPVDDPRRRRPDISRAKTLLGWQPQVPLAKGLSETVNWFAIEMGTTPARSASQSSLSGEQLAQGV